MTDLDRLMTNDRIRRLATLLAADPTDPGARLAMLRALEHLNVSTDPPPAVSSLLGVGRHITLGREGCCVEVAEVASVEHGTITLAGEGTEIQGDGMVVVGGPALDDFEGVRREAQVAARAIGRLLPFGQGGR